MRQRRRRGFIGVFRFFRNRSIGDEDETEPLSVDGKSNNTKKPSRRGRKQVPTEEDLDEDDLEAFRAGDELKAFRALG